MGAGPAGGSLRWTRGWSTRHTRIAERAGFGQPGKGRAEGHLAAVFHFKREFRVVAEVFQPSPCLKRRQSQTLPRGAQ